MEQIYERVAGLDVNRDTVSACARTPGRRGGAHVGEVPVLDDLGPVQE